MQQIVSVWLVKTMRLQRQDQGTEILGHKWLIGEGVSRMEEWARETQASPWPLSILLYRLIAMLSCFMPLSAFMPLPRASPEAVTIGLGNNASPSNTSA